MILVERATLARVEEAYGIVQEYYDAVDVVVRDDADEFAHEYFSDGAGIWLASDGARTVGCIALRPLPRFEQSGEVKRLYVKPESRGQGIAEQLLKALEEYARGIGYAQIYLDSKDDLVDAIRFYQKRGYEICERYNDNPQATIFMRKVLAPSASLRAGSQSHAPSDPPQLF